jgi:chorismate-pyruvate lyase
MVRVETRSRLESALERTSGTVTVFLEQLVGESIDAHGCRHEMIGSNGSNALRTGEDQPLLHRSATLRGRDSGRPYVYAESVIVTSRLPPGFQHRLETGNDPIGRILAEEGIKVDRATLAAPDGFILPRSSDSHLAVGDFLLARTYRIDDLTDTPLMAITEWFLPALVPFLPSQ